MNLPFIAEQMTKEEKDFNTEFNEITALKDIAHKITDEKIIEKISKHGLSEEFYKRFNDNRNEKMTDKIDLFLKNQQAFVAVGAGHLVGEAGLVNLLRKKGWDLKKIEN